MTLSIDDRAYAELKRLSASEGRTVSDLVNQMIRPGLAQAARPPRKNSKKLPTYSMGEPTVDLSERDGLYERMEGRS